MNGCPIILVPDLNHGLVGDKIVSARYLSQRFDATLKLHCGGEGDEPMHKILHSTPQPGVVRRYFITGTGSDGASLRRIGYREELYKDAEASPQVAVRKTWVRRVRVRLVEHLGRVPERLIVIHSRRLERQA